MGKCVVFEDAGLLGRKWTLVVIQQVALHGSEGFNAILAHMRTISPKLLSARLKELEQQGMVRKQAHAEETQLRTSYVLTQKGDEFYDIIERLKALNVKYATAPLPCLDPIECVHCSQY